MDSKLSLSYSQAQLLVYIKENPYCRILDITEDLGIKRNIASRLLHILDEKELIEFTHDPSTCHSNVNESAVFESGWIIKNEG